MDHLPKVEDGDRNIQERNRFQKDRYVLDLRYIEVLPLYLLGVSNHSTPVPSQLLRFRGHTCN